MSEIKVGDIVRIGDLKGKYSVGLSEEMKFYIGRFAVITYKDSCYEIGGKGICIYHISITGTTFIWQGDMFDKHIQNTKEYTTLYKEKDRYKNIKYYIYYNKEVKCFHFLNREKGWELRCMSDTYLSRILILKIEAILRGLESNG